MSTITKEQLAKTVGHFTYAFSDEFFIATHLGNFIWSDPEYGGSGKICSTNMTLQEWLGITVDFGRCKGEHVIGDYVGSFEFVS